MESLNSFIQPLDSADQIAQNQCLRFRNKGVDIGIVSSYFKRHIFRFGINIFLTLMVFELYVEGRNIAET